MERTIVIGAGIGGLTAGALLAKEGHQVTVLEAMGELSGCAGKYRRHPYVFAAGATLGMALEPGGIHERVFRHLAITPNAELLEEVMELHHPHGSVVLTKDRARFMEQVTTQFPNHKKQILSFFEEVYSLANLIRSLMKPLPAMPPETISDLLFVAKYLRPEQVKLAPILLRPLKDLLKKHGLHHLADFRYILDGILIDSMQTTSHEASALFSCIALDIYHQGAYYVPGGLYQFGEWLADAIKRDGGIVKKLRRVVQLEKMGEGWRVMDHRGNSYEAESIVYNGDPRNLEKMLDAKLYEQLPNKLKKMKENLTWGTYSLYIALDTTKLQAPLRPFQQISHGAKGEMDEGRHFFVSSSKPDDRLRAPEGFQTVTISTHTNLSHWDTKEKYDTYRQQMKDRILSAVEAYHPGFIDAIERIEDGAPVGWENYTLRTNGSVGGFAQTPFHALFGAASHRSGLEGLYLCGDHIFPGGGTIGVTTSGLHCARSIARKKLIE